LSALRILYEQSERRSYLRTVILQLHKSVKEGGSFSDALRQFPLIFSPLFVNIIKAAEASGRLDRGLEQIVDYLYRQQELKNKIVVALTYPTLLIMVGAASIFVLITFVVPRLRVMFEDIGMQLPLITKIILRLSTVSQKAWQWILGGAALFILMLSIQGNIRQFFGRLLQKIKTSLPLVRGLIKDEEIARLSRSLHMLISSGVGVLESLKIATQGVQDKRLAGQLSNVCRAVTSGENLSRSMQEQTNLPAFFTKMVAVGEESGRLDEVLDEIARAYTQEVERRAVVLTSLLEPALILFLGLVLGSIVFAVLLPIFQITQMVR
jgi:type II secretory pathway component PulF